MPRRAYPRDPGFDERVSDQNTPQQSSPITIEEAVRRKLWGIFRIRKGTYVCSKPGVIPVAYEWVAWAVDEESALRACVQRGRDERYPKADRQQGLHRWHPTFVYDAAQPTFPICGHPRVVENAYVCLGRPPVCRTCRRARSSAACAKKRSARAGQS